MITDKTMLRVYGVFIIILPLYFFAMFYRVLPSVLAGSLAQDFSISTSGVATLSSVTFMAAGLMHLPSGGLSDVIGARKTLVMITLAAAAGNFLFAVSDNLFIAVPARFLIGIGCATAVPASVILALSLPRHLFARLSGILLAAGPVAMFVAGRPLVMMDQVFGWRAVVIVCALTSLALAVISLLYLPEKKDSAPKRLSACLRETWDGLKSICTYRNFWMLTLWFSLLVGIYFSLTGMWWVPYLTNACGITREQAGNIMSISTLTFPLFVILPIISDKLQSRKKLFAPISVLAFLLLLFYPLAGSHCSYPVLMVHGVLLIATIGMYGGVAFASMNEIVPSSVLGTALGAMQVGPSMIMTPFIQKAFGWILGMRQATGVDNATAYNNASWLFVALAGVALILIFLYKDTYKKRNE